jgi:hypothetical protein
LLVLAVRLIKNAIKTIYFKLSSAGTFIFNGQELEYFRHNYNIAWDNERTVEVAIASTFLKSLDKKSKVLEVGNVLENYGTFHKVHDVLDKYDPAPHVLNEYVIYFKPVEKYDAIISISTLEHVGWDEDVRDPAKFITAVRNLTENCLAPGGCMLVTVPLGYNTYLGDNLAMGADYFNEKYFLKRVSAKKELRVFEKIILKSESGKNEWMQVDYADVAAVKYD